MVQKSTEDIKPVARRGYCTGSLYTLPIKPETKLLSAILLPDKQPYLDDDLFPEINGVTLSQTLYDALGEVSQDAYRRPSFASKVQELMALRYGLLDGEFRRLEGVGKIVGMTRQGVHNFEQIALEYLRQPRYRNRLLLYVKPKKVQ